MDSPSGSVFELYYIQQHHASKCLLRQSLAVLLPLQAAFVLLLLPITTALRGMSLSTLPQYLRDGAMCLTGRTPACGADCTGAPVLPLAYVAVNIAFNVLALYLVRSLGAVPTGLVMSAMVPISIWSFTLSWPLLPRAEVGVTFAAGAVILVLGLLLYNVQAWWPLLMQQAGKSDAKAAE